MDTNVFTASLRGNQSPLAALYAKHTTGRRLLVTPQTVAEAEYGALAGGWGTRRMTELARMINEVAVVDVDAETTKTVAQLRNQCRLVGHALHQRLHNADLWIAAAAVLWGLPLIAHDAVFIGCPLVDLRTELRI